jgi:hypothetical protein
VAHGRAGRQARQCGEPFDRQMCHPIDGNWTSDSDRKTRITGLHIFVYLCTATADQTIRLSVTPKTSVQKSCRVSLFEGDDIVNLTKVSILELFEWFRIK